jgi:hypothetical protein
MLVTAGSISRQQIACMLKRSAPACSCCWVVAAAAAAVAAAHRQQVGQLALVLILGSCRAWSAAAAAAVERHKAVQVGAVGGFVPWVLGVAALLGLVGHMVHLHE